VKDSLSLNIRQTYYYLSSKKKGGYSEASQAGILKLLSQIYGVTICRRTLNYHLRNLEDAGEIKRIRRHKKGPFGKIQFHTTLIVVQQKCIEYLKTLARWFRKTKINSWTLHGLDLDAPQSELHAMMISTYLKTTSA